MNYQKLIGYFGELLIGLCVLGGAVGVYFYVSGGRTELAGKRPTSLPTVEVITLKPERLQVVVEAVGTGVAKESVDISANVQEKVITINFQDGQKVNAGEMLVELKKDTELAELRQAEINLSEEARELERYKRLSESNTIASKEYDSRATAYERARMLLAIVQARLDKRILRAPFAGVLGNRLVSLGDLVSPGTIITTLDDLSEIKVDFNVPEKYLAKLRRELPFAVASVAYPNREFTGVITNISTRLNNATRNIAVRGVIKNIHDEHGWVLRPGMLLMVTLRLGEYETLLLPEKAVFSVGEMQYAFIYNEDGTVTRREILLGHRTNGKAEILNGISAGEKIVNEGVSKLTDKMKVEVK